MAALIWCPFSDREAARAVAEILLDEQLVACVNILGDIESHYLWDGERHQGTEVGALIKTSSTLLDRAVERLGALHPYDTPAIIGWHSDAATAPTRDWLASLKP